MRQSGFTLVEILVVIGLIALIASMLPRGLNKLYAKSSFESFSQSVLSNLRDCAAKAQLQQRAITVGSLDCDLPKRAGIDVAYANDITPVFFIDGTSNGAFLVVQEDNSKAGYQITINRFSSKISMHTHVGKP